MSHLSHRAQNPTAARSALTAVVALSACNVALADTPHNPAARTQAAMTEASARGAPSAARAAAAGSTFSWQGRNLEQFIMDHQRWMFSIPLEVNAANPVELGANCGINQQGATWNLLGPALPTFTVNCTVPAGKAIFMPALGYLYDFPCPEPYPQLPPGQNLEAFLRGLSADFIDRISHISMSFDGRPVRPQRAATGVFSFTGAKNWANYDVCVTGSPQLAQADGLWLYIDPPSVGRHTVKLNLTHPDMGTVDGTWVINVVR